MKKIILLLGVLFLLSACGPSPEEQATMTATAMTATAAAWTPTPTATNTPTFTPSSTPTETPTPTLTPTSTASPTSTSSPTPTQDPDRYYPPDNTFSILVPEGWETFDLGLKYPSLMGPQVEGIFQNLIFVPEESTFPMAMYAAFVQDNIEATLQDVSSISEEFLITSAGIDFFKWITESTQQGMRLRQIFYIFENGDWKLTIVYTRQAGEALEQDALIDDLIDTIKFTP